MPSPDRQVTDQATAGIEEATRLLQDIRAGRGTVGQLFTDDALYSELRRVRLATERVASRLPRARHARQAHQRRRALPRAAAAVGNLNAITSRIRNGEGSLGKLLNDPALANSLTPPRRISKVTGQTESRRRHGRASC